MKSKSIILIIFSGFLFGCSNGSKESLKAPQNPRPSVVKKEVSLPKKVEEPIYEYSGNKFNDPFIPLFGNVKFKISSNEEETTLDPASLVLNGIIIDSNEKMASLVDGSGNNYIVQNKRLYNKKREIVEGIVAIVKLESVVIITQDKTVRELKLRSEEEY